MRPRISKPRSLATRLIFLSLLAAAVMSGPTLRAQDGGATHSVELASGLTLQGRLAEATLRMSTALGQFDVAADQLQTLAPREPSRVTHTLVTRRGDVLVGKLASDSLRERKPGQLQSLSAQGL